MLLKNLDLIKRDNQLNEKVSFHYELAPHTWLKAGGRADIFFMPDDIEDLQYFLKKINKQIPIFTLGAGSNTLFRDLGFNGVVIKLGKNFDYINFLSNQEFKVGAATNCIKMARFLAKNQAAGLEFFSGIPGSIGGAIRMNAGAYGCETSDYINKIKVINRQGKIKNILPDDYEMSYRQTSFPDEFIFLEATFKYIKNKQISENLIKIKKLNETRKLTQPITDKTSGSTFKNPKNMKAWKLIKDSGCKGLKVGKASLSNIHANFIINKGGASSTEIEDLGEEIRKRVLEKFGINLIWEIKIIGRRTGKVYD